MKSKATGRLSTLISAVITTGSRTLWAAPHVRERRKLERQRRWIASLSDRDWARLAERADQVNAGFNFARFDDLDAPIAVGVYDPKAGHMPNGQRFGTLRGCVLMAWAKANARR